MECDADIIAGMLLPFWKSSIGCRLTALQMYQIIVFNESIPDIQKNSIVMVFSEFDKRIIDGADEHLTILDMALRISGIMAQS